MQSNSTDALLLTELDTDTALAFFGRCKAAGLSASEMLTRLVSSFLAEGDNHPLFSAVGDNHPTSAKGGAK